MKIWLWLRAVLGLFAGLLSGFALCLLSGQAKSAAISVVFGFTAGLISGYGILFRFPDKENKAKIGRYAFWPALMPGAALAEIVHTNTPMIVAASGIIGFLASLILYFKKEFGKDPENIDG